MLGLYAEYQLFGVGDASSNYVIIAVSVTSSAKTAIHWSNFQRKDSERVRMEWNMYGDAFKILNA